MLKQKKRLKRIVAAVLSLAMSIVPMVLGAQSKAKTKSWKVKPKHHKIAKPYKYKTKSGKWIGVKGGKMYLLTPNGKNYLVTPRGQKVLVTPKGKILTKYGNSKGLKTRYMKGVVW